MLPQSHECARRRRYLAILPCQGNGPTGTAFPRCGTLTGARHSHTRPWQCLYFFPEPQGQGALRGVPAHGARGPEGCPPPRGCPPARRRAGPGAGEGGAAKPSKPASAIIGSGSS